MRELFLQVSIPLNSQSPHKASSDKRTNRIKLLFKSLHQVKTWARLAPYTDESFHINGTALDHQAPTCLLRMQTKPCNHFHKARCCIPPPQFNIQNTTA